MVAALKTYRESTVSNDLPRLIEAFKRAKEFNHPNVVRYLDYGVLEQSFENLHFVVMELAPLDLEKYILNHSVVNSDSGNERFRIGEVSQNKNREYSLSLKEVTLLFRDILKGYDYLHQNKIIHRDLKPQNILIYRVQGEIVPKISDHDECKISELDLVRTTMIQGTREYAAPELFEKHLSNNNLYETVDIYSLGCIYLFVLIKTCLEVDGKTFFDWMIVNQEEKVHNFIKERIEMLYKNTNEKIRNCIIRLLYCTIKKSPLRIPLKDFYAVIKYILSLMNHSETADLYEDVINDSLMEEILKKNEK
ncbi:predicted protein [Naegleria gruberi]|uniref:non-specific serine/threonine protein kinase n=1 Tax=Naegleria gruberi TaxID=5762 RepID=D2W4V1_NAEGR|nr:uncharacterized protein NAEGRDRAFT_76437 [Naegleria gruberi]EFC35900.1 predicted protein [Naegleria gruberi]|eukprot:XP_002668644.1 predicted protein [Naegleria gruberi strain NEG-M]